MPFEQSSQATVPPPQSAGWVYTPLLAVSAVALYFCWPVVINACLPFLGNMDAIEYVLLGAVSLLWLASCIVVSSLPLTAAAAQGRPMTFAVGWLVSWPLLVAAAVRLQDSIEAPAWFVPYLPWVGFYLVIPGTILWLMACYGIYDTLFTIMEARWPATKGLRPIVSGLLRSFLHHHH